MTCTMPGGAPPMTVPYTLTGAAGYPRGQPVQRPGRLRRLGRGRHDRGEDHLRLHPVHAARLVHRARHDDLHPGRVERDADGAGPVSGHAPPDRGAARSPGQGLVEFADVVPVFVLLLLGMLEFGFAFSHHLTLEYATREGARVGAALANGDGQLPCAPGIRRPDHRRGPARPHLAGLAGRHQPDQRDPDLQGERRPAASRHEHAEHLGPGRRADRRRDPAQVQVEHRRLERLQPRDNGSATPDSLGVSLVYSYELITPARDASSGCRRAPDLPDDRPHRHGAQPELGDEIDGSAGPPANRPPHGRRAGRRGARPPPGPAARSSSCSSSASSS